MGKKTARTSLLLIISAMLVMTLSQAGRAFAASRVTVSAAGNGVFLVQGAGLESVGAMDITLTYDTSTLANPRVVQGGLSAGAMMAVNDTKPGAVRLGIIRINPMQGNGVIATITFDRKGSSPGKILSLAASFSENGKLAPVSVQIANPPQTASGTESPSSATGSGSNQASGSSAPAAAAGGTAPAAGILALGGGAPDAHKELSPGTTTPDGDMPPEDTISSRGSSSGPLGMTVSNEHGGGKVRQFESVLDRFRNYQGKRSAEAFLALFERREATGFSQDPPVALSDGKARIKVMFVAPESGGTAPDFALNGAHLLSIIREAGQLNGWVLEARPDKGEYRATLLVSRGESTLGYPLTLAPKVTLIVKKSGQMTKKDFNRYVLGKRRDLNNDGKEDYIDDYIATANFIATRHEKKRSPAKSK